MAQEISENLLKVIKGLKGTKQTYKESLKNKSWNLKHSSKFKIPTVSKLKLKNFKKTRQKYCPLLRQKKLDVEEEKKIKEESKIPSTRQGLGR